MCLVNMITELGVSADSEAHLFIYSATLSYLSGHCTAFEYQHALKPYLTSAGSSESAKSFRLRLLDNSYVSLMMKMMLFALGDAKRVTDDRALEIAKRLDIKPKDRRHTLLVWFNFPELRRHVRSVLKSIPKDLRPLLELARFQEYFSTIYTPVMKAVKYKTYTKLRFIAKSSNSELTDLHSELMVQVTRSFYSLFPIRLCEAHVVNYLKRCVHNKAMNMIEAATTQKRGRLVNVGVHGFSLLVMSENQLAVNPDNPEASYEDLSCCCPMDSFELEYSVSEVLSRYRTSGRKYRMLRVLMGSEDAAFTTYLRTAGLCSQDEDNVDLQMRLPVQKFNVVLRDFLGMDAVIMAKTMSSIAKHLALPNRVEVL